MQKPRVVAFAYDNPTFEGQPDVSSDLKQTSVEIKGSDVDTDRDIERLIYPDAESTFRKLKWQFWIVQLLIITHIIVIGYTDPPPQNNSLLVQILVVSIQIGLIVVIMMAFFVFTSQTIFIRFGRYDKYLKEFGVFFIITLVQLALISAIKAYYIVLFSQRTSPIEYMNNRTYYILWVVQRNQLLMFWVVTAFAATRVFRECLYDPDYLLSV